MLSDAHEQSVGVSKAKTAPQESGKEGRKERRFISDPSTPPPSSKGLERNWRLYGTFLNGITDHMI